MLGELILSAPKGAYDDWMCWKLLLRSLEWSSISTVVLWCAWRYLNIFFFNSHIIAILISVHLWSSSLGNHWLWNRGKFPEENSVIFKIPVSVWDLPGNGHFQGNSPRVSTTSRTSLSFFSSPTREDACTHFHQHDNVLEFASSINLWGFKDLTCFRRKILLSEIQIYIHEHTESSTKSRTLYNFVEIRREDK